MGSHESPEQVYASCSGDLVLFRSTPAPFIYSLSDNRSFMHTILPCHAIGYLTKSLFSIIFVGYS